MVSVIILAFNEEATVAGVVRAALTHPSVKEVIVVDDGSCDETASRAREAGAHTITLPSNRGKAGAMGEGVARAMCDVILFLDADCEGFTHETISAIIDPVLRGDYAMYVGINSRRSFWLNRILHFFPILSGDRAMRKVVWEAVPQEYKERFQIEIALNYFSKQFSTGAGFEVIHGVRHIVKERKHGLVIGFVRRLLMIKDILVIAIRLYIVRNIKGLYAKALPF